VGVTGYRVERCQGATCKTFVQVGTPTGTSFSDTGLTRSTTYRYRMRAGDAAGNLEPYSGISTATTNN
jgi:chitodextrinase